jgi:hypothetical protein
MRTINSFEAGRQTAPDVPNTEDIPMRDIIDIIAEAILIATFQHGTGRSRPMPPAGGTAEREMRGRPVPARRP